MNYHFCKKNQQTGFTLVETALSLTLVGIAIAALVVAFKIYTANMAIETTKKNTQTVARAIENFILENGRFPCAAAIDLEIENPRYGQEADCANLTGFMADGSVGPEVTAGYFAGGIWVESGATDTGQSVVRGMVPFQTLNLPEHYVNDGYGSRLFYAVTASQANADTFMREGGQIGVIDGLAQGGSPQVESNHFIVFSAGPNRMGAYSRYGKQLFACAATGLDAENCNTSSGNQRAIYRAAQRAAGANYYDDYVVNSTTLKLPLWRLDDVSLFNMRTIDLGNRVMMGAVAPALSPPELRLDVSGAARAAEGASFHGERFCLNGDGEKCFESRLIADDMPAMDCGNTTFNREAPGDYMRGIAKSEARCANDMAYTCPAGQYIVSMNGDGTPACRPYVFEPPPLPGLPDPPPPTVTGCVLGPEVRINDYDGWQGELDDPTPNNVCYGRNYIAVEHDGNGTFRDFEGGCGSLGEGDQSPGGSCLSRITHNGANWADATRCEVFAHICTTEEPPETATNGECGGANTVGTPTAPNQNLCTSGTATEVTDAGTEWTWSCQGSTDPAGTTDNCSAPKTDPGEVDVGCGATQLPVGMNCMAGETTFMDCAPTQRGYQNSIATERACGMNPWRDTQQWGRCVDDPTCAAAPECGTANGGSFIVKPADTNPNLCASGAPSTVEGSSDGPWTWTCGGTAQCSASKRGMCAVCEPGRVYANALKGTDCSNTYISNTNDCRVTSPYPGGFHKRCGGINCSASCGDANGTTTATRPSGYGLCGDYDASPVAEGATNWTWTCYGASGSSGDATCSANKPAAAASCYVHTGSYATQPADSTANGCTAGEYSDDPDTPTQWSWTCTSTSGGATSTASCSAARQAMGGNCPYYPEGYPQGACTPEGAGWRCYDIGSGYVSIQCTVPNEGASCTWVQYGMEGCSFMHPDLRYDSDCASYPGFSGAGSTSMGGSSGATCVHGEWAGDNKPYGGCGVNNEARTRNFRCQ